MVKVVILGGSYAAHFAFTALYKNSSDLEVTLVSATSHSYFNIPSPRLLWQPERIGEVIFPIEEFVAKKSNGKGKFIHGKATSVDFGAQTVTVATNGSDRTLDYDLLVLATGSKTHFNGFKVNDSHLDAKKAIKETAEKLKTAKLVAVIGGGPTGVETVGELAYAFKSTAVTLYTGSTGPLPATPQLLAGANTKLKTLGVEVINKVRVKSIEDGTIVLDNEETLKYDVVINATNLTPYSEYLPESVKDKKGFVVTDNHLVVKGTTNVLAIGDIVSGGSGTIVDMKFSQNGVFAASANGILSSAKAGTKKWAAVENTIFVPISPTGGEGILFGWRLPNFLVRIFKAKTFFFEKAAENFLA